MQEQDPRRDVLGCNRKTERTLRTNPRKNRSQSKSSACFIRQKHSSRLCPLKERAHPKKNHENDPLTIKPLSGMRHRRRCNGISQVASGVMTPLFWMFRLSWCFEPHWVTGSSSLFTLLVARCRMLRPSVLRLRTKSDCGWSPINPKRFRVLDTWERNTGTRCAGGSQKKTCLLGAVNHELDMDLDVAWHCPVGVGSVLAGLMLA